MRCSFGSWFMPTTDPFKKLEVDMRRIQEIAIAAALASGDAVVKVPGKTGTPARQFDMAAHTVLEALCGQLTFGPEVEVIVITEESPNFEDLTAATRI